MTFIYKMNLIKLSQEEKLPEKWNETAASLGINVEKTPLNVNLIPDMTSNTEPLGTCGASGSVDPGSINMVSNPKSSELNSKAHIFFSSKVNALYGTKDLSYASETKTDHAISFWYKLDPSQYNNGFFDPGTYEFTLEYGDQDSNHLVQNLVYVQNEQDEWVRMGYFAKSISGQGQYWNTPCTFTGEFTCKFKFKSFKVVKTNQSDMSHTRSYYRYGTQLKRLAKCEPLDTSAYKNKLYTGSDLFTDDIIPYNSDEQGMIYNLFVPRTEEPPVDLSAKNWSFIIKTDVEVLGSAQNYYQLSLDVSSNAAICDCVRLKIGGNAFNFGQYETGSVSWISSIPELKVGENYLKLEFDKDLGKAYAYYSYDNAKWNRMGSYTVQKPDRLKYASVWTQHTKATVPVSEIKFIYDGEVLFG